jgi:ubiquinone/menaquinone biosynthesis C-methylase UbiE
MDMNLIQQTASEEARIRAAYAKREKDDARYSWFNPAYQFIMHGCERRILARLTELGFADLQSKSVLEVGCGRGYWLREFVKWGARPENVTGIDLLMDRVLQARELCPPGVRVHCGSAAQLPFSGESFDVVLQATVFTSILDRELQQLVAAEMLRVVKSDGLILWYDYHMNNPINPDVKGVKARDIRALFPKCQIHLERVTLAPPLARLLAPCSYLACCLLEKFPPLCTHYLGDIRKI